MASIENSFSNSDQSDGDEIRTSGTRRRGKMLEDSILEAAWEELSDEGYNHFTMDGVAARAKTSKAVIYRRWAKKTDLVIAAIRKFILPQNTFEEPDTGSLRDDVFAYLKGIVKPLQAIGAETIQGLVAEYLDKDFISSIPQIVRRGPESKLSASMITILKHAEAREELKLEKISPRIISLPADLLRFEIITTYEPVSDEVISELVDDIFMPLIRETAK